MHLEIFKICKTKMEVILVKNKRHSNFDFRIMSFFFKIRDIIKPPIRKIIKAGIKSGQYVLDYGCGAGSYTFKAAKIVGPSGKVFAADIHPLAIKKIKKKVEKLNLNNIKIIQTNCDTGLENNCINTIICFDMLHEVPNKSELLNEFYRVLKPNGILSIDDHHLKENGILEIISPLGLFELIENWAGQLNFKKVVK